MGTHIHSEPVEINIAAGLFGSIIEKAEFVPGKNFQTKPHGQFVAQLRVYFIIEAVFENGLSCFVGSDCSQVNSFPFHAHRSKPDCLGC